MADVADRRRRPWGLRQRRTAHARGGEGRRPHGGARGRGGDGTAVTDPAPRHQLFAPATARVTPVAPRGTGARDGAGIEEGNRT